MKKNWDETPAQSRQRLFDYPYEITDRDLLDLGHEVLKASPKRPWRCPHCLARLAYQHTLNDHLRTKHAALLPGPQRTKSTGPMPCRWCPNGYRNQAEADLHEHAAHSRNLALLIGLDRPL